ncbi:MAG: anion permease [Halothiobacillaceae bacterium]
MEALIALLVFAVLLTVIFDFSNGFHDASNMMAAAIASRAMTPRQAVTLVGGFTFLGPLLGGTAVANTVGGFVTLDALEPLRAMSVIVAGLLAAVVWNFLTWWRGLPSSSSHALVGGLIGAVLVNAGPEEVIWGLDALANGQLTGVMKIVLALLLSPALGFLVAFVLQRLARFLLRGARPSVNRKLRAGQWVAVSLLAFSHGTNDAQKSMGILTLILLLGGFLDSFAVPFWVVLVCTLAITAGTMLGGWRIVRTLGFAIYRLRPLHGLNSQVGSGLVIHLASMFGAPVSTTHVVSSAIMGIGAAERPRAVRWGKAREIVLTWLVTLPGCGLLAAALAMPLVLL